MVKKEEKTAEVAVKEPKSEIIVNDAEILAPVEKPLIVVLPADASEAQVAYAKILNQYAYQNPAKWAIKKDAMIAKLEELKNAPAPVSDGRLKVNDTVVM